MVIVDVSVPISPNSHDMRYDPHFSPWYQLCNVPTTFLAA